MAKRKTQAADAGLPPELRDDYEPLPGEIVASGGNSAEERPTAQSYASGTAAAEADPAPEKSHVQRMAVMSDRQAGARFHFNYQRHTAEISFDEKPTPEVRSVLKENGYRWNAADQVWAFRIEFQQREQDRLQAKKVFHQVTALMRERKASRHRASRFRIDRARR